MNSAPLLHHVKLSEVLKFVAVKVETRGGGERTTADRMPVAECNALQTNRAILPPEGGERAFEIMLPLQEAVEATTDVLQIRRTVL